MFEVPTFLKYQPIVDIEERPELVGLFVYVIAAYQPGHAVLIKRNKGEVGIKVGDWDGNTYEPDDGQRHLGSQTGDLCAIMKTIGIDNAQYFFSNAGLLVDVQLTVNKYMGPGMLRDLYSKIVPVQRTLEIISITPDIISKIKTSPDRYAPGVIIKPSRYRFYAIDTQIMPLYGRIICPALASV